MNTWRLHAPSKALCPDCAGFVGIEYNKHIPRLEKHIRRRIHTGPDPDALPGADPTAPRIEGTAYAASYAAAKGIWPDGHEEPVCAGSHRTEGFTVAGAAAAE